MRRRSDPIQPRRFEGKVALFTGPARDGGYDATKRVVEPRARFPANERGAPGGTVNTISPGATEARDEERTRT